MDKPLTNESTFQAVIGYKAYGLDDETILVDLLTDKSFRLNATGTLVWRLAVQGQTLEAVARDLASALGIDEPRAFQITRDFLAELVRAGAVAATKEIVETTMERE